MTRLRSFFHLARGEELPIFLLFLYLLVAAPAPAVGADPSAERAAKEIPRFHRVAEGLFRGGQPTSEGFQALRETGIKTVINLREENDEKEWVEKLGMSYAHIPLSAWDRVPAETIRAFFHIVNDPAKRPVFVHCRRGADRTGVMVGFYRIALEGWTAEEAYQEARRLGMRWWYRGLKKQLFEFARQRGRSGNAVRPLPAASPLPQ